MKKSFFLPIILLFVVAALPASLVAQPHYAQVLKDLEAKNLTLHAAAKQAEAQQHAAHVGLLLENPDIEAAYYWGDPSENGVRWDFSVSQSFEMPSVLVRRARLRNLQENAAHLGYRALRYATLLQAQQLCADLIYYRNMAAIYSRRCVSATRLAQLYQHRYEAGDCSILEYNRAQMNLADMQNKSTLANLDVDLALHDLCHLMNVETYSFLQMTYDSVWSEPSFEAWYEQMEMRNPELLQLDNQLAISRQEERLSRAQWLPQLSVGYAAENVVGDTWRGATVGVTLPLWSQQRAVRAAKLQTAASQATLEAKRTELFTKLECMYHRHKALIRDLQNLKSAFRQNNSVGLLDRALEMGEISLEQYLQQVNYYNEIETTIWSTARQLEQLHLLLYSVEL
ncbi:MAG: TolC family protein [Bacteroidales bacterium]|nr:TolC family protein [Bacteroidales bacterium]